MSSDFRTTSFISPARAGLAQTVALVKERLVVQPRPDALGVATVAFMPLLQACGLDVFDLNELRGTTDGTRMLFRVRLDSATAVAQVHAVGTALPRGPTDDEGVDGAFTVRTNGADWQLLIRAEDPYPFSLYDDLFTSILARLFQTGGPDAARRIELARVLLQQEWLAGKLARLAKEIGVDELRRVLGGGEADSERVITLLRERRLLRERHSIDDRAVRQAMLVTLRATEARPRQATGAASITLDDILRHAEAVANLRGRLHASFDGVALPITSRNGLYVVLAALAVQVECADAVPSDDLIVPPALVPPGVRARSLGEPGWHLLLTREKAGLADAIATLIAALGLQGRLEASQSGRPYPDAERTPPQD
ncbi:MAG: hypothetical protein P8Z81_08495 [Deinococcales bacterium]